MKSINVLNVLKIPLNAISHVETEKQTMKQCIFYLPYELSEHGTGARMLRPMQMIQAFEEIGYNVFVIQGYSRERKARISELKRKIMQGDVYDFMYTEAHTMPTLLTERHHFPTHPFLILDFLILSVKTELKLDCFMVIFIGSLIITVIHFQSGNV